MADRPDAVPSGHMVPDPPDSGGGMTKQEGYGSSQGGHGDPGGDGPAESAAAHSGGDRGSGASAADTGGAAEYRDGEGTAPPTSEIVPASDEGVPTSVPPLIELNQHSELWFRAIEEKHCLVLMNFLEGKEDNASRASLCSGTGKEGRTALHVAAMQGCFRLAKQVIDLICDIKYPPEGRSLSRAAREFIDAKDGRSGLTAFEMADEIIGNTSISWYITCVKTGPNRKGIYRGMYEAYESTEWHTALAQGNCNMLRKLLRCNSRYLLQTCDGFSVLDVAIMKDNAELVETVVKAFTFGPGQDKISWPAESYFPPELQWEQVAERHYDKGSKFHTTRKILARLGLPPAKTEINLDSVRSALELSEKFASSEEIKKSLRKEVEHASTVDQERVQALLRSLSAEGVFKTSVDTESRANGESIEMKALESELPEFEILFRLACYINRYWKCEWNAGFLADVDYNFEDKSSLRFSILRLHYAFKRPWQCRNFIFTVLDSGCIGYFLNFSCNVPGEVFLHDGQGRTPFHTMVDFYNPKSCTFDEFLYAAHHFCDGAADVLFWKTSFIECDARGRIPILRAVTKQFLEEETMVATHLLQFYESLLKSRKEEMRVGGNIYIRRLCNSSIFSYNVKWLFYLILLFQDEPVSRAFLNQEIEASDVDTLDRLFLESSNGEVVRTRSLLVAAAAGNQSILRLCLKKFDPMVEDGDGRTALHYAADANMFKFCPPPRSFYCSVDYPTKVLEQWMKMHKEELLQSRSNSDTQPDSNRDPKPNANVGRRACILMLLQAGVDLSQEDKKGDIPDPGACSDAEFQKWWYELVVKDTLEKKNGFNQAGNALAVVGTLVAATSYVGPLQPPMNYDGGHIYAMSLVRVFMMSNTLAFYLAVASVMFAVVPSLPMPQEGVLEELGRARQMVSSSLFLLLASIGCILVSFGAASAVVVDSEHYYGAGDFLLKPSIIGWFFCLIAMVSFFIRMMRLVFYRNSVIRQIYKFSFSALLKKRGSTILSTILSCTIIFCLSVLWSIAGIPYCIYQEGSIKEGIAEWLKSFTVWPDVYAKIKDLVSRNT